MVNRENNIFSDLSFSIGRKDRIAIIGANGKGKVYFTKLHGRGVDTPTSGSITKHPSGCLGHFGQTNIDQARTYEQST